MTRPDDFDFEAEARERRGDRLDRWVALVFVVVLIVLAVWGWV